MSDLPELWLNSPAGYPMSAKIAKSDVGQLKSFLINMTPDEALQEMVRQMSHQEVIENLESSGFSFQETWQPAEVIDVDTAVAAWSRRNYR